jgi:hypothetical protein
MLLFVGRSSKGLSHSSDTNHTNKIVATLVPLTLSSNRGHFQDKCNDIAGVSQSSLKRVLNAMKVSDFIAAILWMLESSEDIVSRLLGFPYSSLQLF